MDPLPSTTTTTTARQPGQFTPPDPSRIGGLTIAILLTLRDRSLIRKELAESVDLSRHETRSLSRALWQCVNRYGLVKEEGFHYSLTETGMRYYTTLANLAESKERDERWKYERRKEDGGDFDESSSDNPRIKKAKDKKLNQDESQVRKKQIDSEEVVVVVDNAPPSKKEEPELGGWLAEENPSTDEVTIVECLLKHYLRTGRKYLYVRDKAEAAERFEISSIELGEALSKLDERKEIYFTTRPDARFGKHRIGIQQDFLRKIMV